MWARSVVLLTLCLRCGCLDVGDMADLFTYMHNHHEHLRTLVHQYISPKYVALHKLLDAFDDPNSCAKCHQEGAKFIMEHSMEELGKMCKTASQKNCKMEKLCEFMAKKPEVTMGMMIEHVRPFSLTMAYCAGKGVCHKPNATTLAEMDMDEQPHEILLSHFDQVDWYSVMHRPDKLLHNPEDDDEPDADVATCESSQHACPKCMKGSMKRVMRHVAHKFKGMCMHAQCPRMQRFCRFAREHRGVAFGMILAKVEPWKFAFGHCVGESGASFWKFVKKVQKQIQNFITV